MAIKITQLSAFISDELDGNKILEKIEQCGRICYKSIPNGNPQAFVRALIKSHHHSVLEHASVTCLFCTDRGISHECVRHRLCSFSQESTRYVAYTEDVTEDKSLTFVCPSWLTYNDLTTVAGFSSETLHNSKTTDPKVMAIIEWLKAMEDGSNHYFQLLELGWTPEKARDVLPHAVATKFYWTANLREWRHILNLRAVGTTGRPHPNMVAIMQPLLKQFQANIPVVFDDLEVS